MKHLTLATLLLCLLAPLQIHAQFTQQGNRLRATDAIGGVNVLQGSTVSISGDGNTAIVGGNGDNSATGAVWLYTRTAGVWTQLGKLVGTGATGKAAQGVSVAISADGNTAIVGGHTDNSNAGAAWVYSKNAGVWSQEGAKLVGTSALSVPHTRAGR